MNLNLLLLTWLPDARPARSKPGRGMEAWGSWEGAGRSGATGRIPVHQFASPIKSADGIIPRFLSCDAAEAAQSPMAASSNLTRGTGKSC